MNLIIQLALHIQKDSYRGYTIQLSPFHMHTLLSFRRKMTRLKLNEKP